MVSAEQIRKKMRITHTHSDGDIADNIEAARLDMSRVGIDMQRDNALLTRQLNCTVRRSLIILGRAISS